MMARNLRELEADLSRELDIYAYPERIWPAKRVSREGEHVFDVAIVGGGQAATATAVGLIRERISNFVLLDENPAGQEGPWVTWARMITLRTPKNMTGPDCGLVSATFRAWFEAQFGAEAWRRMNLIPKEQWMEYLIWIRRVMGVPVENDVRVEKISGHEAGFEIRTAGAGGPRKILARKVVLATGLGGAGGPRVPALVTASLGKHRFAHSSETIDFAALAGKRVAVLGGNASAFDNAAAALDGGAGEVVHFIRRAKHPEVNTLRYLEFAGLFRNFAELDDDWRIRFTRRALEQGIPPPPYSIERCEAYDNYRLLMGSGWTALRETDAGVEIATVSGERHVVDYLILGTGFEVDLGRLDFLSELAPDIELWSDRVRLADTPIDREIGRYPYLGRGLECRSRSPEKAGLLSNLHFFNWGALVSVGPGNTGVNGMPFTARRLVEAISRDLFLADVESYWKEFSSFEHSEFEGAYQRLVRA